MTNHQRLFHTSVEPKKKVPSIRWANHTEATKDDVKETPCACEVKDKLVSSWIGYWHIDTTLDRPPEKTWWSNFETMINLLACAWKSMVNNGDHSSSNIRLSKSAWKKYKPAIDLVPDSDLDGFLWICTDLHLAWKISVPDQKSVPKRKDLPRPMSQEVEETLTVAFLCLPKSLFEFPAKQTANLSGHSAVFAQYLSWNLTMPTHLPKINLANLMYRKLLFGSLWCVWFQYSPNCKLGQWLWYA